MTATVKAIYEQGVLRLKEPLSLANGAQVDVTVTSDEEEKWETVHGTRLGNSWLSAQSKPEFLTSLASTIIISMAVQRGRQIPKLVVDKTTLESNPWAQSCPQRC